MLLSFVLYHSLDYLGRPGFNLPKHRSNAPGLIQGSICHTGISKEESAVRDIQFLEGKVTCYSVKRDSIIICKSHQI